MSTPKFPQSWKPGPAEAKFLGEVLNIDAGLAQIARDMLAKGYPLDYVVETFKAATKLASALRATPSPSRVGVGGV